MPEYIERETLMLAIEDSYRNNPHSDPKIRQIHNHEHRHFLVLASKQPAADVVEVVRCKDCEHYKAYSDPLEGFYGQCLVRECDIGENDYCSYGERKEGAENG